MLIIRQAQMDVLTGIPQLHAFILEHLRQHFPLQTEGKTDRSLDNFIHKGRLRALRYGIEDGPGICAFVDLMMALGDEFDTRPRYRWLATVLLDRALGSPAQRMAQAACLAALAESSL